MCTCKRNLLRVTTVLSFAGLVAGCVGAPPPSVYREPEIVPVTLTQSALKGLPPPAAKIPVAVYEFPDQTGQFKPQENVQTLSRAVSQGGAAILIKALRDAGGGTWFTTLERNGLDDLLKERQIIADMRLRYLGERTVNPQALPPLLFAGILLQGGIVGFDTNTLTGGLGARFLGIGGDVEYRQNTVTVNLRAVSVKTGEVLANVTTSKTLASVGISGGAFKFVSFDKLLEVEAGITNNEPGVMALRRTIEKAVYGMIMEGSETGLWAFQDTAAGKALVAEYNATERGEAPTEPVEAVVRRAAPAAGQAEAPEAEAPVAAAPEAARPGAQRAAAEPASDTLARSSAVRSDPSEAAPAAEAPVVLARATNGAVPERAARPKNAGGFRWADGVARDFPDGLDTVRMKAKKGRKATRQTQRVASLAPPPSRSEGIQRAAASALPEPAPAGAVRGPRFVMTRQAPASLSAGGRAPVVPAQPSGPQQPAVEPNAVPVISHPVAPPQAPGTQFAPAPPDSEEFTGGGLGA